MATAAVTMTTAVITIATNICPRLTSSDDNLTKKSHCRFFLSYVFCSMLICRCWLSVLLIFIDRTPCVVNGHICVFYDNSALPSPLHGFQWLTFELGLKSVSDFSPGFCLTYPALSSVSAKLLIFRYHDWLIVILQCCDTVGWVIGPVKSSPKWPIMCRVGRYHIVPLIFWHKLNWPYCLLIMSPQETAKKNGVNCGL